MKPKSLWPLRLYRVNGSSMEPTYRAGDLLLGWRWARPRIGRVVVARTPERPVVKRVARIDGDGLWLEGDNVAASTDSRRHGSYPSGQFEAVIVGRVLSLEKNASKR